MGKRVSLHRVNKNYRESAMHLKTEKSKKKLLSVFILSAALLSAALLFTLCYSLDNKYTSSNSNPSKDLVPLTGQWEF